MRSPKFPSKFPSVNFVSEFRALCDKIPGIALVAVMRKMLHVLNRLLADPNFVLAS